MSETLDPHILARFEIEKLIGGGAYGFVWRVVDRTTRLTKALKKNYDAFNNSTDAQRTYREIMFLMELQHPTIIKLEEVIRADNNKDIYLVFQHMDVDLHILIRQKILAQKHRKFVIYQMACALYFLHSAGLIHRDIKPANVLVNENCQAKLCDFGLVRSVDSEEVESQDILTQYIATRWYRAPQILLGSVRYTKAIDIWSFGCLLAQMQRGKPLFAGTSTINQIEKVLMWTGMPSQADLRSLKAPMLPETLKVISKAKKMNRRQLLPGVDAECMDLISRTLQFDPAKRITIQEILAHPYLQDYHKKEDLIVSSTKIKVNVNDNQRLTLKEYRNMIYEEIRKKNKSVIEPQNTTLYRIKQPVKKGMTRKNDFLEDNNKHEAKTVSMGKAEQKHKGSLVPRSRHLKTIEKEWNPMQEKTKLKTGQKQESTKYEWNRKKRSATQSNAIKKTRLLPSPADLRRRMP